mmetsp:Transcript_59755/g.192300  ORF Transcript_59755/g.192300 Transcript_59755/m.192300 type:complete len:241 (+) Transcript_59755:846-1568(+)
MTCRNSSSSLTDCSWRSANLLAMTCVISVRNSSIFLPCSACIFSSVSVTVSLVKIRPFRVWTSCWSFCHSSFSLPSASAPVLELSCSRWMHSKCRWRICTRLLWLLSMKVAFSTFRTCIIFWAKPSVMNVSLHQSASGPMFAMSIARAEPPRQSRSNIVRAEFLNPAAFWFPAFRLLTTAPKFDKTRLMPIACRLLNSSSVSLAATTFFKLSEPARSTSMSLPRLTGASFSLSARHSMAT